MQTINVYAVVYGMVKARDYAVHVAEFVGPRDAVRTAVHYFMEGASAQSNEQGGETVFFVRDDVDEIPRVDSKSMHLYAEFSGHYLNENGVRRAVDYFMEGAEAAQPHTAMFWRDDDPEDYGDEIPAKRMDHTHPLRIRVAP